MPEGWKSFAEKQKGPGFLPGLYQTLDRQLRQRVTFSSAQAALNVALAGANREERIDATSRTGRLNLDVVRRPENVAERRIRIITVHLVLFQRPGVDRTVNLLHVGDASVLLAHLAGFNEVGDRDRGKQTNDRNDDHDFHERKPSFLIAADFHFLPFSLSGVDERERPVYEYCVVH